MLRHEAPDGHPVSPDCVYLATARSHPPAIVQRRREREARFFVPMIHDLTERQHRLFLFLQSVIGKHREEAIPPITDADVAEAASALASTLETERRGIIYEHRAVALPAQRLESELKTALDVHRTQASGALDRDIVMVLRRTERAARNARLTLDGSDTAYLDFVQHLLHAMTSGSGQAAGESPSAGATPPVIIP